jgi:hypothetical protein
MAETLVLAEALLLLAEALLLLMLLLAQTLVVLMIGVQQALELVPQALVCRALQTSCVHAFGWRSRTEPCIPCTGGWISLHPQPKLSVHVW